MNLKKLKGIYE